MTQTKPSPGALRAANIICSTVITLTHPANIAIIIDRETGASDLLAAAKALLQKLDHLTTDEFSLGGEREEREALRAEIAKAKGESK